MEEELEALKVWKSSSSTSLPGVLDHHCQKEVNESALQFNGCKQVFTVKEM